MATGYGGTYKAVVIDNVDPESRHRVLVLVPDVDPTHVWATAVDASASPPAIGDEVAVVYEGGDSDYPMWQLGHVTQATPASGGVHKGIVVNNVDPNGSNRLEVTVPDVLGATAVWANPGPSVGPTLPDPGRTVTIEFEGGSTDHPVWTGAE